MIPWSALLFPAGIIFAMLVVQIIAWWQNNKDRMP
jgi:hypothetical protein